MAFKENIVCKIFTSISLSKIVQFLEQKMVNIKILNKLLLIIFRLFSLSMSLLQNVVIFSIKWNLLNIFYFKINSLCLIHKSAGKIAILSFGKVYFSKFNRLFGTNHAHYLLTYFLKFTFFPNEISYLSNVSKPIEKLYTPYFQK